MLGRGLGVLEGVAAVDFDSERRLAGAIAQIQLTRGGISIIWFSC